MAGRWAGAQHAHNSPIHSPNADTASQTGYNIANDKTPLICRLTQEFGGLTLRRKQVSPGRVEVAGGRKMPRADSEELGFELRRRPSNACMRRQMNIGQRKPQAKVTHRLAQRAPVWRCGGYTPRRVALNSMARLITMLPERALHRADSEKLCFELRRRPTSA